MVVSVNRVDTGPSAAARSGTNVAAPAYAGHDGPLADSALTATTAAPTAPRASPSSSASRGSSRSAGVHSGTAPATSPSAAAAAVRPTTPEASTTAIWSRSGCAVENEAITDGKLLTRAAAEQTEERGEDRHEEPHGKAAPAPRNDRRNRAREQHGDGHEHDAALHNRRDGLRISLGALPFLGNEDETPEIQSRHR